VLALPRLPQWVASFWSTGTPVTVVIAVMFAGASALGNVLVVVRPHVHARYACRALTSPISDLNPLERAWTELKLAPGFLVRSAPKPRRVVDRVGA
jgi:hypothetical protein